MESFNNQPGTPPENIIEYGVREENEFWLDDKMVLENKEAITDFFGDNRETWYKDLLAFKSIEGGRISLDSQEPFDVDLPDDRVDDLPPLEPNKITPLRAKQIALFFESNKGARVAFLETIAKEEPEQS